MLTGLLLAAIAVLGVRTSLKVIMKIGIKPVLLVVSETLFLSLQILGFIYIS